MDGKYRWWLVSLHLLSSSFCLKDPQVCLVWAKMAKMAPMVSLGCPETLAFLVLLVLRGPLASVTPRLAKEL